MRNTNKSLNSLKIGSNILKLLLCDWQMYAYILQRGSKWLRFYIKVIWNGFKKLFSALWNLFNSNVLLRLKAVINISSCCRKWLTIYRNNPIMLLSIIFRLLAHYTSNYICKSKFDPNLKLCLSEVHRLWML